MTANRTGWVCAHCGISSRQGLRMEIRDLGDMRDQRLCVGAAACEQRAGKPRPAEDDSDYQWSADEGWHWTVAYGKGRA